jgi:hypothetical protein
LRWVVTNGGDLSHQHGHWRCTQSRLGIGVPELGGVTTIPIDSEVVVDPFVNGLEVRKRDILEGGMVIHALVTFSARFSLSREKKAETFATRHLGTMSNVVWDEKHA